MLASWLQKENIQCNIFSEKKWQFEDVRTYSKYSEVDSRFIYIMDGDSIPDEIHGRICFLRYISDESQWKNYIGKEEIVCLSSENLFAHIQCCIFYYRNWYNNMMNILLEGADIRRLIDVSQSIFENPIILDDIGFRVLACSNAYETELYDAESRYVIQNGCHTPEYIRKITEHSVFLHNLKTKTGPFIYHYEFLEHESVYCPVCFNGEPIAFLTIVGKNGILGQNTIDLAVILIQMLVRAFALTGRTSEHLSPEKYLLINMLHGESLSEEVVQLSKKRAQIKQDTQYYIVRLLPEKELSSNIIIVSRMVDYFREHVVGGQFIIENQSITAIVQNCLCSIENFIKIGEPLLSSWNYIAGFSYLFYGNQQISVFYRQAESSIKLAGDMKLSSCIIQYEEVVMADFIFNQLNFQEKMAAVHPSVMKLWEYDKEKDAELLLTVQVFFEYYRNLPAIIKKLHIHKNTLYYRLRLISDIMDIDFEESIPSWLYISVQLLKYEKICSNDKMSSDLLR